MRPVSVTGVIKRYKGNGRALGYPTANLSVPVDLKDGVYFGFADLAEYERQPALIFIGVPTTLGDKGRRVEAHILDIPDEDYYDQKMHLEVVHFHRPNQTFESLAELISVMASDEAAGRAWFAKQAKEGREE